MNIRENQMKIQVKGLMLAGAMLLTQQAEAGNWLRDEGEQSLAARASYSTATQMWNQNGTLVNFGCGTHTNQTLGVTYDYGLSYHYTLFADAGLHNVSCGVNQVSGLGDVGMGIRGRIDQMSNGKAWELKLLVPGGYNANATPLRLGYGEIGLEAGVYFGPPFDAYDEDPYKPGYFPQLDSYWEYGAWTRVYTGAPATVVGGNVKYKHSLTENWKVGPQLGINWTTGKGQPQVNNLFGNRMAYSRSVKLGVEFSRLIGERLSFHITPELTLMGENTTKAKAISIGIHKAFPK
jgi:hypothetical protein